MDNAISFLTLLRREVMRFISLPNQTLLPPVISMILFVIVFGYFLGNHVKEIAGFPYIVFIYPGLLMMGVTSSAYQNSSSSLFISRWMKFIEDLLVAPISFFEMVIAFTAASVLRGLLTGLLTILAGLVFVSTPLEHPFLLLFALTMSSIVFSSLGLIVGLWADRWDHIAVIQNYFITPLTFLGGVFYSSSNLPENYRWVNEWNPLYYMVTACRYSFLGRADESFALAISVTSVIAVVLTLITVELFRRGYKLRT